MTGDTMQARPRSCVSWCCSPMVLAISACLPACMMEWHHLLAKCLQHVILQADVTTATMLFTMVEALEAAKAPLQHVYFSQGIKYYVSAHTTGGWGSARALNTTRAPMHRVVRFQPGHLVLCERPCTVWLGFSQGIKHYVSAHTMGGQAPVLLLLRAESSACANPAWEA